MTVLTHQTERTLTEETQVKLDQQLEVIQELFAFYYQDSLNNAHNLSDIFTQMFPSGIWR